MNPVQAEGSRQIKAEDGGKSKPAISTVSYMAQAGELDLSTPSGKRIHSTGVTLAGHSRESLASLPGCQSANYQLSGEVKPQVEDPSSTARLPTLRPPQARPGTTTVYHKEPGRRGFQSCSSPIRTIPLFYDGMDR